MAGSRDQQAQAVHSGAAKSNGNSAASNARNQAAKDVAAGAKKSGGNSAAANARKQAAKDVASSRADPAIGFSFFVEIDGIQCVQFREASGLEWKADPEAFYEGGNNNGQIHLVGRGQFTPLKLKKGFFSAQGEFFNWMKALMDGGTSKIKRATVSVVVRGDSGSEIGRFNLFGAFMTRYAGPGFNAMEGTSVAFEEVELVYDRFEFKPGSGGRGTKPRIKGGR